jgi:hypothetical protein
LKIGGNCAIAMAISAQTITSANSAKVPISLRMRMDMVRDFADELGRA